MEIQPLVKQWIDIDDRIKEINAESKKLREQKETLGEQIIKYMISKDADSIIVSNKDTLCLKKSIQLGSINKDYIKETLTSFFNQPHTSDPRKLADDTTNVLVNNRETVEKMNIRRKCSK